MRQSRREESAPPVAHEGPELEAEEAGAGAHEQVRQKAGLRCRRRPADRQRRRVPRHVGGSRREAER